MKRINLAAAGRCLFALAWIGLGATAGAEETSTSGRPAPAVPAADFRPDPPAVVRQGPGYRYPQAGWIVLHIEGAPYERGYQHGKLLAGEIADYVRMLAKSRGPKAPEDSWKQTRQLVNALFLRRYDGEQLQEMKGIADGAADAGAKFDERRLDLVDIVAVNSDLEIEFLDSALDATATGLEGIKFPQGPPSRTVAPRQDHCSAFAATGPATADGKIVFGHITMFSLLNVTNLNVWLDVQPADGHRVLCQTFPGGIWSGLDYYLNDAGLLMAETTLDQTRFNIDGTSVAARARRAMQYADTIDKAVAILLDSNNGLYTNEWLLGDIKTNEIAMLELGTHKSKLWRSSRDEWPGGTKGFYWGCNNTKDLEVRKETVPSLAGKPANLVFHPADRDLAWQRLFGKYKTKITADFGFEAFTTAPLAAFPSCDAKFTTTALAKELKSWALFGPPLGRTWEPTVAERRKYDDIQSLVSNDWTLLHAKPPAEASAEATLAIDLDAFPKEDDAEELYFEDHELAALPAAWRGTLLPESDADIWLAAAFADYERIVALEKTLRREAKDESLSTAAQDRLDLSLFASESKWLAATRRLGRDIPLSETHSEIGSNEWYDIAAGKGVQLLAGLRKELGAERFDRQMDEFGRAHAGQRVKTAEFRQHMEKAAGKSLASTFDAWLTKSQAERRSGSGWSIDSFESEPQRALIIYGTLADRDAQREAATHLQRKIARRWSNILAPIKSEAEVTADDLKNHHLLLIGRPAANALTARCTSSLPVKFGHGSFTVRDELYAHADSALIAAGGNPHNPRYSAVVYAGLGARATWRLIQAIPDRDDESHPAEVYLIPAGRSPQSLCVSRPR